MVNVMMSYQPCADRNIYVGNYMLQIISADNCDRKKVSAGGLLAM